MKSQQPTQIVILGGSGDLSQRKLLPALFELHKQSALPKQFSIIGLARTRRTDQEYRTFVHKALLEDDDTRTESAIESFVKHICYVAGDFDNEQSYKDLFNTISNFEKKNQTRSNILFYLAVPPRLYEEIFTQLHKHKLVSKKQNHNWSRILVEKPFGKDLGTAQKLEEVLSSLFSEEQIFRIDHYLAKEAVQNILSFRFANTLFQDVWDKTSIESVHITMHEKNDLKARGSFYDGVGALRDVGQNHLLQLFALITMEEPSIFSAQEIRNQRTAVLQKIKLLGNVDDSITKGQYDGYTLENGVASDSTTETYFSLQAAIATKKWRGVPFYITAGKAMSEDNVSIEIIFKDIAEGLFDTTSCLSSGNKIIFTISPVQTLSVTLNAKAPGLTYQLEQRALSMTCMSDNEIKNSYQKVLLDCIEGDQTLFASTEEVFAAWKFITPILEKWSVLPLATYEKGSTGPKVVQ